MEAEPAVRLEGARVVCGPRNRQGAEEFEGKEFVLANEGVAVGLRPYDVHARDLPEESQKGVSVRERPVMQEGILHAQEEGRQIDDVLRPVLREQVEVDVVPRLETARGGRTAHYNRADEWAVSEEVSREVLRDAEIRLGQRPVRPPAGEALRDEIRLPREGGESRV